MKYIKGSFEKTEHYFKASFKAGKKITLEIVFMHVFDYTGFTFVVQKVWDFCGKANHAHLLGNRVLDHPKVGKHISEKEARKLLTEYVQDNLDDLKDFVQKSLDKVEYSCSGWKFNKRANKWERVYYKDGKEVMVSAKPT